MEQSYKEKYEKALEKIKNLIDKDHNDINVDDILNVFPELAESEDEKVRKEIIELVMQPIWKTEKEFHRRNELCAWLKKQGQVKESTISQQENRTCEENNNSLTSENDRIRKEIINYFQCQSEEEPTRKEIHDKWISWLENIPYTIDYKKREGFHLGYKAGLERLEIKTAEESLGIDSDTYNKIVDECIFGEQKPADKVEPKFKVGDKIYLKPEYRMPNDDTPIANTVKEIRRIDDKHYRFDGSYIFIEDQDKYELVEQKPEENKGNIGGVSANSEWCEEDSFRTETLISVIKSGGSIRPELRNEYINWLQSLRPQNRWKPSETDIMILEKVFSGKIDPKDFQATLQGILEQLKKL